jgi:type I restriction enzyme, S subunit
MLDDLINQAHGGVGLQHVTKPVLGNLMIGVPSMAQQKRIVELLGEANRLQSLRRAAYGHASDLIPALFHEMFGQSQSWRQATLRELLVRIDSGWSPVCDDEQARSGRWGVLKLSAVTFGEYRAEENKALREGIEAPVKIEVRQGDVLFTRKNTRELVAATAYVWQTRPQLLLSDLIFRLQPDPDVGLDRLYLCYALKYPPKRYEIQSLAGGSAGSMPNISKERLFSVSIPLPPLRLQRLFADKAGMIHHLQVKQRSSHRCLDDLFQSLLHRAFQGEI